MDLKDIQGFYINEHMPQTWDDLDWNNPKINDPRYLYSLYQAIVERVSKDRQNPVLFLDQKNCLLAIENFNFRNNVPYTFKYFKILYAYILSWLQAFNNIDRINDVFTFENNKRLVNFNNLGYNSSEMSNILGYDFREIPKAFQNFEYYSKFLKGMKNAIQSMKWIYFPLIVAGSNRESAHSYGSYKVDDDGNYTFTNGSKQEAFDNCKNNCISSYNKNKYYIENGVLNFYTSQTRSFVTKLEWNENKEEYEYKYKGCYDSFSVAGICGVDFWLESLYKWNYTTTIKTYYIPSYRQRSDSIFINTNDKKNFISGTGFDDSVKLLSTEQIQANTRFKSAHKLNISLSNIDLPNSNYKFNDEHKNYLSWSETYYNERYCAFIGMLDVSTGCKWL